MTAVQDLDVLRPSGRAREALHRLAELEVNQLLVVRHGGLLGMVTRVDTLMWMALGARSGPGGHRLLHG
jgi:CBS domain-containing protein